MTPFDYTKDILQFKKNVMTDENEGEYVPFVVNRVLSNYIDCILHANDMNRFPSLSKRMQFDYYFHSIEARKRPFIAYPKAPKTEDISLIMMAYNYSARKAREAVSILTEEQIEAIKALYNKGGTG